MWAICAIYSYILILLSIIFFVKEYRNKRSELNFYHFIALCFCGLFLAFLCVEVANRYFTPFFVFLTIFAASSAEEYIAKLSK